MIRSSTNTGGFDEKMIGFNSNADYDERSEREIRLDAINKRLSRFITCNFYFNFYLIFYFF